AKPTAVPARRLRRLIAKPPDAAAGTPVSENDVAIFLLLAAPFWSLALTVDQVCDGCQRYLCVGLTTRAAPGHTPAADAGRGPRRAWHRAASVLLPAAHLPCSR